MSSVNTKEMPDLVDVRIGDLPSGCELRHPLYGERGTPLLAAGSKITRAIKEILGGRGIQNVRIHPSDADVLFNGAVPEDVTGGEGMSSADIQKECAAGPASKSELPREIDDEVEGDGFVPKESGPAVRDRMVSHGRTGYDPEQRKQQRAQHRETKEQLISLMNRVARGMAVDGKDVMRLSTRGFDSMVGDCDSAITIASGTENETISAQSQQTASLAMAIAIEMGMDAESVQLIGAAGLVGDWGMMRLPKEVRGIKRSLNEQERFEMQKVPILTANILQEIPSLPKSFIPIVYQVHERLDGSGYPRGRDASSIHPFSKILHVADIYTTLTAPGPGPTRQPAMPYAAMERILREAGARLVDADVARALLRVLSLFPLGSYVALSDRSVGRVIRRNRDDYASPIVQIIADRRGNLVSPTNPNAIMIPERLGNGITRPLTTPGRDELSFDELGSLSV